MQLLYSLLRIPNHLKPIIAGAVCSLSMLFTGVPQSISAGFKMTNDILMRRAEYAQVFPFVVSSLGYLPSMSLHGPREPDVDKDPCIGRQGEDCPRANHELELY